MSARDPLAAGARLAPLFRSGMADPVSVCERYLERIECLNPQLNAFLDVFPDAAREGARASMQRWREGRPLSPLDGVPVAVKANIAISGAPWHAGIEALRDRMATEDAEVMVRLRRAGAVLLGTLNLHEGALGATTDNPWFGRCENPHRAGFTPGGSSGGSGAAVAAGLCALALGTDTMGSVRIPAAYCGIAGHKPQRGRVPMEGVVPLSWTLDHVGPLARGVGDLTVVLPILDPYAEAGLFQAEAEAEAARADRLRIGIVETGDIEADEEVLAGLERARRALEALGAVRVPVALEGYDFGRMRRRGLLICEAEASAAHGPLLAENPEGFSKEFRGLLAWGAQRSARELTEAYLEVQHTSRVAAQAFERCDVLLAPVAPQTAFPFGTQVPANQADFTAFADFAGIPATAVPSGASREGLPVGVQVLAPEHRDALGLGVALALEQALGGPAPVIDPQRESPTQEKVKRGGRLSRKAR